jgi:hypothetical protein
MRALETLSSVARGFSAGKYILADVGLMKAAQVTMSRIYLFCLVLNAEYTGPLGTMASSSRSLASFSAFRFSVAVKSPLVDAARED